MILIIGLVSLVSGLILGAGLVRYGIGLGARIVNKTADGLPAFGGPGPALPSHVGEDKEIDDGV
jgi:hypothetical protein